MNEPSQVHPIDRALRSGALASLFMVLLVRVARRDRPARRGREVLEARPLRQGPEAQLDLGRPDRPWAQAGPVVLGNSLRAPDTQEAQLPSRYACNSSPPHETANVGPIRRMCQYRQFSKGDIILGKPTCAREAAIMTDQAAWYPEIAIAAAEVCRP